MDGPMSVGCSWDGSWDGPMSVGCSLFNTCEPPHPAAFCVALCASAHTCNYDLKSDDACCVPVSSHPVITPMFLSMFMIRQGRPCSMFQDEEDLEMARRLPWKEFCLAAKIGIDGTEDGQQALSPPSSIGPHALPLPTFQLPQLPTGTKACGLQGLAQLCPCARIFGRNACGQTIILGLQPLLLCKSSLLPTLHATPGCLASSAHRGAEQMDFDA
eukprot:1160544-Pelagomonas_calceolata.AAC.8